MTNKSWRITILAILAIALLSIGGVVYYGTVALPAQRLQQDIKACDEFANGVIQARGAAIGLLDKKPPASASEVATRYANLANEGIDRAFNTSAANGQIYNALSQVGMGRLDYNESDGMVAIQKMEATYDPLLALCKSIQPTPSPTATATSSPSASSSPTPTSTK